METYGGGTWFTWLDRDLGCAGRVIVAQDDGKFVSKLVNINRPILRVPNLPIHLDRTMNEAFKVNKETQMRPIAGLVAEILNEKKESKEEAKKEEDADPQSFGMGTRHHSLFLKVIADELECEVGDIQDFEL